jgi:hypothetical protein
VRYVFPAYANRPPAVAAPADGRIEAPAGTEVDLTIVATEPLSAALLGVGGEKQLMARPTAAPTRGSAGRGSS